MTIWLGIAVVLIILSAAVAGTIVLIVMLQTRSRQTVGAGPKRGSCPECGAYLEEGAAEGLCPRCLYRQGLKSSTGVKGSSQLLARTTPQGIQAAEPPTGAFRGPVTAPALAELARLFPQLEILELLGQGGMGAVYKARQPALDRLVALKVLPVEMCRDPAFAERFGREARSLARLSHPNIVAVHDSGQAGELYYFIMEYVDGLNLRQLLRAGQLKPDEALKIVPQICEALQFAHDEGIVHRDIKPENILLDKKGRVKIADFGLAKLLVTSAADLRLTATYQVMGTPHYMAPEQMEKPLEVDHRADIYSLGVVFYEMLTGELPLGRFAAPSQRAAIDQRLDDVVLRALEKDPPRRYQHASDVKTDLEAIARAPFPGRWLQEGGREKSWERAPSSSQPIAKTSTAALTSFILSLAGFLCSPLSVISLILGIVGLMRIRRSQGKLKGREFANVAIVMSLLQFVIVGVMVAFIAVPKLQEANNQVNSRNNLKMIGTAFHNYHDGHGQFPAAAIKDKAGKPLLSWRVALLPYLEQEPIYGKFRLDEPWDSPRNKDLLLLMPKVYAAPGVTTQDQGMTYYRVFVGPGTAFEEGKPLNLGKVFAGNGTSSTILVVEAANSVPWTKPDELSFTPSGPLPKLGFRAGTFNALFVDGSARPMNKDIDPGVIRGMITRGDGAPGDY